ncbi:MAG: TRAP transporter permease DctM/Q [Hyphomicrobiales bacterium]|nr:TRAP transporter fused permease subunit [Hyphomicrobiales bacterium]PCJ91559.1 MAG: TRAP transporter permease DctM/Q [Hyphomicrobiales bacterium]
MTEDKPSLSPSKILMMITTITVLWHLVMIANVPAWFGTFISQSTVRAVSLTMAVLLVLMRTWTKGQNKAGPVRKTVDLLVWAALALSCGFVVFFEPLVQDYGFYGQLDQFGLVMALMLCIPLLEALRRTTGPVLPILILTFVAIAMFQQYLPGVLHGRGYSLDRLLFSSYVGTVGVFGKPLGIAVNVVIVFLVFGALMERAGASRWFMDLAMALTGRTCGGPAKAAVVASAMFGSISGSPSSNSATTGVFTIPMMKEAGFKPQFAAAVEAVASTGGMILPPVMGAIAFLMAEWIGRSYLEIVTAALIPAILYYLIVFASVHLEARRRGIKAMPTADIPAFWSTLFHGWYYAIPMAVLIYFLIVKAYPPGMAAIYTSASVILCSFLSPNRSNWLLPRNILLAFHDAVMRWLVIVVITAAVGIMIGALELSGVGLNVSRFIVDLGGGNLLFTLVLVGVVSLIVGMGLDATPAYVTLATLMVPALVQLGVPDIAAHLYVVYWGLASFFTPPTCIAIFVTAPIAGASVWKSGWEAMSLGIAAFLIPIAFALEPALLLEGDLVTIFTATTTALLGSLSLTAGLRGFAFSHLNLVSRLAMSVGGVLLILPGVVPALTGIGLALAGLALCALRPTKEHSARPIEASQDTSE